MILIADSGSTKTDWRLVNNNSNQIYSIETIGFNPYFIDANGILDELSKSALSKNNTEVKQVFFYGAGCSSSEKSSIVQTALQLFFNNAQIDVEHDLLAAARAVSGNTSGLVAILGTGANTCLYDGKNITTNIPALGYLLGDEGSGAHLGMGFIKKYLHHEFSEKINEEFSQAYPNLNLNKILDAVYKQALPNRFLAQFSRFVHAHAEDDKIKALIIACMNEFFEKYICKYPNYSAYKLNLVGSVAFYYQNFIREIALIHQIEIDTIIKQPIDALVKYHCNA
ncbi:MAG: N-acetylglucosamine kinase [Flavobacteriales bacterium CG_4_9_14_0_2_um_filter_32_27]|nr:MAG: N-acetylglucosamine kinase [Flavobacteriales bacterium CG_4_9_14_0_2_um_filter_32_27]